jgi:PhoH-like ATPase
LKKTYVLDTNVLLQNPNSIFMFDDNEVIITDATIQELDKFKKEKGDRGYNAREAIRNIEGLRKFGSLEKGIKLPSGGTFKIEFNFVNVKLPDSWEMSCDNRVLRVCKGLMEVNNRKRVILVSQDAIMRIKADIIKVKAQDYQTEQVSTLKEQYTGRKEVFVDKKVLERFFNQKNKGCIHPNETFEYNTDTETNVRLSEKNFTINQFLILKCLTNPTQTALGYFDGKDIKPLLFEKEHPYGVTPRSVGQKFFQEAL